MKNGMIIDAQSSQSGGTSLSSRSPGQLAGSNWSITTYVSATRIVTT